MVFPLVATALSQSFPVQGGALFDPTQHAGGGVQYSGRQLQSEEQSTFGQFLDQLKSNSTDAKLNDKKVTEHLKSGELDIDDVFYYLQMRVAETHAKVMNEHFALQACEEQTKPCDHSLPVSDVDRQSVHNKTQSTASYVTGKNDYEGHNQPAHTMLKQGVEVDLEENLIAGTTIAHEKFPFSNLLNPIGWISNMEKLDNLVDRHLEQATQSRNKLEALGINIPQVDLPFLISTQNLDEMKGKPLKEVLEHLNAVASDAQGKGVDIKFKVDAPIDELGVDQYIDASDKRVITRYPKEFTQYSKQKRDQIGAQQLENLGDNPTTLSFYPRTNPLSLFLESILPGGLVKAVDQVPKEAIGEIFGSGPAVLKMKEESPEKSLEAFKEQANFLGKVANSSSIAPESVETLQTFVGDLEEPISKAKGAKSSKSNQSKHNEVPFDPLTAGLGAALMNGLLIGASKARQKAQEQEGTCKKATGLAASCVATMVVAGWAVNAFSRNVAFQNSPGAEAALLGLSGAFMAASDYWKNPDKNAQDQDTLKKVKQDRNKIVRTAGTAGQLLLGAITTAASASLSGNSVANATAALGAVALTEAVREKACHKDDRPVSELYGELATQAKKSATSFRDRVTRGVSGLRQTSTANSNNYASAVASAPAIPQRV